MTTTGPAEAVITPSSGGVSTEQRGFVVCLRRSGSALFRPDALTVLSGAELGAAGFYVSSI